MLPSHRFCQNAKCPKRTSASGRSKITQWHRNTAREKWVFFFKFKTKEHLKCFYAPERTTNLDIVPVGRIYTPRALRKRSIWNRNHDRRVHPKVMRYLCDAPVYHRSNLNSDKRTDRRRRGGWPSRVVMICHRDCSCRLEER